MVLMGRVPPFARGVTGRLLSVVDMPCHRLISTADRRHSTVDTKEIAKFESIAAEWWDPRGGFRLLHSMNAPRVSFIREQLLSTGSGESSGNPIAGMSVLDVGCGAGILASSLARLSASVVGLDASERNISIARQVAAGDPGLKGAELEFRHSTVESGGWLERGEKFDMVCLVEVVEHVSDPAEMLKSCAELVRPGGYMFVSTINRNLWSYISTILMGEFVLRLVPPETHDYNKYLTPDEVTDMILSGVGAGGMEKQAVEAMYLNPFTLEWSRGAPISDRLLANYIACYRKKL